MTTSFSLVLKERRGLVQLLIRAHIVAKEEIRKFELVLSSAEVRELMSFRRFRPQCSLFAILKKTFFGEQPVQLLKRNLIKCVTELSRAGSPSCAGKRFTNDKKYRRQEKQRKTKFLREILFLSNIIIHPFTTLSQVVITFNEDERAHEILVLKTFLTFKFLNTFVCIFIKF